MSSERAPTSEIKEGCGATLYQTLDTLHQVEIPERALVKKVPCTSHFPRRIWVSNYRDRGNSMGRGKLTLELWGVVVTCRATLYQAGIVELRGFIVTRRATLYQAGIVGG